MRTVYLAGPINGCTDAEARDWRTAVREAIGAQWKVLDPMDRDYRGREAEHVIAIVEGDITDLLSSDAVIVNAARPSWGTAMELVYARDYGVRVIAFGTDAPSPWLSYHADTICSTLGDALVALLA